MAADRLRMITPVRNSAAPSANVIVSLELRKKLKRRMPVASERASRTSGCFATGRCAGSFIGIKVQSNSLSSPRDGSAETYQRPPASQANIRLQLFCEHRGRASQDRKIRSRFVLVKVARFRQRLVIRRLLAVDRVKADQFGLPGKSR